MSSPLPELPIESVRDPSCLFIVIELFKTGQVMIYQHRQSDIIEMARLKPGFRYDHYSQQSLINSLGMQLGIHQKTVDAIKRFGDVVEFTTALGVAVIEMSQAPTLIQVAIDHIYAHSYQVFFHSIDEAKARLQQSTIDPIERLIQLKIERFFNRLEKYND